MEDMYKAGSYARRSKVWDKGSVNKESIEQQEGENVDRAEEEGWELPAHRLYRDNDLSAKKEVVREDWLRLNQDIEDGEIDILILWESSRGDREAGDWINFLGKCQKYKVRIHVTSDERTYNLDIINDWKTLALAGIDSQVEVLKIKKRTKRHMKDRAKKGLPHSRAPYGYEIYGLPPETIDGKVVHKNGRRPVYPEADIAIEVIKRIAESEPLVAISNDLNSRGTDSPSVAEAKRAGKELSPTIPHKRRGEVERTFRWSPRMLRKIGMNVAYIGKREYENELIDAQWEAIIDEETFWAAYNVLTNPERKTTKPGKAKHLVSYIAKCDECDSFMGRKKRGTEERYQCNAKGCTTIRMSWVDDFITELTCQRLARPDVFDSLRKKDTSNLHAELARLNAEHNEALDLRSKNKLSLVALSQEEERLLPRIRELEQQLRPTGIPQVVKQLVKDANGNVAIIRKRWDALDIPAQKEVIRTLYEYIKIGKASNVPTRTIGQAMTEEQIAWTLKQRVHIKWK